MTTGVGWLKAAQLLHRGKMLQCKYLKQHEFASSDIGSSLITFNPRTAGGGGGGESVPPSGFLLIAKNGGV